jgi:hypothetical protein
MQVRNISSIPHPKTSSRVFSKIQKGTTVFVPLDVAIMFAQGLFGEKEVPGYATESIVQKKLDYAFEKRISPWHVIIQD